MERENGVMFFLGLSIISLYCLFSAILIHSILSRLILANAPCKCSRQVDMFVNVKAQQR